MGAWTLGGRRLICSVVLVTALGATVACTDDEGRPDGGPAAAVATARDALPPSLAGVAPAGDVLAVLEGTGPTGARVRGLVARDEAGCTAAVLDDGSSGPSVLASPADPDVDAGGDENPSDLLASTLHTSGQVAAMAADSSTTSVTLQCGPQGALVVLDPLPADLQVVGSGSVVRYTNGFPVGVVVGPAGLRERATAVAAAADAPDPDVLALPRLAVDDTAAGTLTAELRRHVVATFVAQSPSGPLTGAVALTGTQCELTVVTADGPLGLGGGPDLALTQEQRTQALVGVPSATFLNDGGLGLACAASGASVLLSGVQPAEVSTQGAITAAPADDGGTVLLVGTASARRSGLDLLARR